MARLFLGVLKNAMAPGERFQQINFVGLRAPPLPGLKLNPKNKGKICRFCSGRPLGLQGLQPPHYTVCLGVKGSIRVWLLVIGGETLLKGLITYSRILGKMNGVAAYKLIGVTLKDN